MSSSTHKIVNEPLLTTPTLGIMTDYSFPSYLATAKFFGHHTPNAGVTDAAWVDSTYRPGDS